MKPGEATPNFGDPDPPRTTPSIGDRIYRWALGGLGCGCGLLVLGLGVAGLYLFVRFVKWSWMN